jgi:hypothetical protein
MKRSKKGSGERKLNSKFRVRIIVPSISITFYLSTNINSLMVNSLSILFIEGVIGYSSLAARIATEVIITGSYACLFSLFRVRESTCCKNLSRMLTPISQVSNLYPFSLQRDMIRCTHLSRSYIPRGVAGRNYNSS